jgi:ABC-type glycerol-3-phosphate transport system permease component
MRATMDKLEDKLENIVWPQLMAGSVIASVPCMVLCLALQNYLVKGLTAGAVKE